MIIIRKIVIHVQALFRICVQKIQWGNRFRAGKKLFVRKGFSIEIDGGKIEIGDHVFFNRNCSINSLGEILIGSDCLFGEGVKIYDHNHKYDNLDVLIRNQGFSRGKVRIGNNCWIGSNSVILMGADIGDNTVIAAGTVVRGKINNNSLVYDVKEQIIKDRM